MLKLILSSLTIIAAPLWAGPTSLYCPQHTGYINLGMSQAEVIAACGEPLSKKPSDKPISRKVPVKQLVYNNEGATKAFYGVWALPIGNSNWGLPAFGGSGGPAGGSELQVNIVNHKVSSVILNAGDSKGINICGGNMIKVGDAEAKVSSMCGVPTSVNDSFMDEEIPSSTQPEIWVYQPNEFKPPQSLTFVDGKLQSIE